VAEFDPAHSSAILSRDTSADVERFQIEAWRRMSPLEKTGIMSQATSDVLTLALAGIRQRHPGASARECFIRLAALQLGPTLVRQVYPDASQILGPGEPRTMAQAVFGELVWPAITVLGQWPHGRDVTALRPCGEPSQSHTLQHPLA
jgi:hypothetical protein